MKPPRSISAHINVRQFDELYPIAVYLSDSLQPVIVAAKVPKVLPIAAILLCAVQLTSGTTMIAITGRTEGLLALDSRQVIKRQGKIVRTETVCKIAVRENVAYAASGWIGPEDNPIDLGKVLDSIQAPDAATNMYRLETYMLPLIRVAVSGFTPADIIRYRDRGEPITSIFAVAFEVRPVIHYLLFTLSRDLRVIPANGMTSEPMVLTIERGNDISGAIPSNFGELTNLIPLLRNLMVIGLRIDQETSARPISIVQVTRRGLRWIERGACH